MATQSQSSAQEGELARQKADEVLRATHERFRVIFDTLPAPCVVYDADRRFRFINKAMSEMLRRPEEQIIGCRDEELMPVQFTQVYLPVLCQAITSRTPQMAECAFTGAFGTLSYIAHYVPLLDDAGGEVREVVGIATTSRHKSASSAAATARRGDSIPGRKRSRYRRPLESRWAAFVRQPPYRGINGAPARGVSGENGSRARHA